MKTLNGLGELSDVDPKAVGHGAKVSPLFRNELKGAVKNSDF